MHAHTFHMDRGHNKKKKSLSFLRKMELWLTTASCWNTRVGGVVQDSLFCFQPPKTVRIVDPVLGIYNNGSLKPNVAGKIIKL